MPDSDSQRPTSCRENLCLTENEKIAVYIDANGVPTHATRQLADGTWTSKLGELEDITHPTLAAISNEAYGTATIFLRRVRQPFRE